MSRPAGARDLLAGLVDPGSWQSWDLAPAHGGVDASYAAELARAAERAGTDEAVLTGRARIRGHDVALIVSEFRFLGGSIGRATADRIVAAVGRATAECLPLVAAPASGGTRMQEGTPAFVTMVDISRAVVEHKNAGLPYLVYLRHPTTGGVFASWGSLGHVTLAEPAALIGFLGPKVYEALSGAPFPPGVQIAENLVAKGVIDGVVPPADLADVVARTLRLLRPAAVASGRVPTRPPRRPGADVWSSVRLSRRADRPGVLELLRYAADDHVLISGTGAGESGHGLVGALAAFEGLACVVVGQDRRAQATAGLGPADLRAARRFMQVAQQLRRPLVCLIDTPGADLSVAAEEGALASEIARCLADLVQLSVPSVAVLMGEGCGGAALALLPCRRVIAAEHSWLSPLPPEGASTILHGTTAHAAATARRQRIGAAQLLADGVVHVVVPEPSPAHVDPANFCRRIAAAVVTQLAGQLRPAVTLTGEVYTLI
ncbi:carboxyl transferase domain-containing protein [Dactylosporangium sp. NPDC005555]|uniref:carboxyl transferase domain-containing protein n=1 Tax=Dactylosporangium sp. NPDC005555 TaxID=3154889 RepID=UPI0033B27EAB